MKLLKAILIFCLPLIVNAKKLSFGTGYYNVDAQVKDNEASFSNFGAYRVQYHSQFDDNWDFIIGYSIIIEKIYTGDKSFGPTLGFNYYPFGSDTVSKGSISNVSIVSLKLLNPYLSGGFTQRQYQSVDSSYSGFNGGLGVEIGWKQGITIFSEFQYSSLSGPNEGSVSESMVLGGLKFNY